MFGCLFFFSFFLLFSFFSHKGKGVQTSRVEDSLLAAELEVAEDGVVLLELRGLGGAGTDAPQDGGRGRGRLVLGCDREGGADLLQCRHVAVQLVRGRRRRHRAVPVEARAVALEHARRDRKVLQRPPQLQKVLLHALPLVLLHPPPPSPLFPLVSFLHNSSKKKEERKNEERSRHAVTHSSDFTTLSD